MILVSDEDNLFAKLEGASMSDHNRTQQYNFQPIDMDQNPHMVTTYEGQNGAGKYNPKASLGLDEVQRLENRLTRQAEDAPTIYEQEDMEE